MNFPFLDYGSAERRHQMCREEIRLNRRLAPRIYLRTVGIAREDARYFLTAEDDPAAVEYAVEMRRVEEDRSLEALIRDALLQPGDIDPVARRLARFHADASVAPRRFQETSVLFESLEENLRTLGEGGNGILATGRRCRPTLYASVHGRQSGVARGAGATRAGAGVPRRSAG